MSALRPMWIADATALTQSAASGVSDPSHPFCRTCLSMVVAVACDDDDDDVEEEELEEPSVVAADSTIAPEESADDSTIIRQTMVAQLQHSMLSAGLCWLSQ